MDGSEYSENLSHSGSIDKQSSSESNIIKDCEIDRMLNSHQTPKGTTHFNIDKSCNDNGKDNRKQNQSSNADFIKSNHDIDNNDEQLAYISNEKSSDMFIDQEYFGSETNKCDNISASNSESSSHNSVEGSSVLGERVLNTCSSSIQSTQNDSDNVNYHLSMASNNDENKNAHGIENSLSSDASSSTSQDFIKSAPESVVWSSTNPSRSGSVVIQPGELTDQLEEGPLISLPPTQFATADVESPATVRPTSPVHIKTNKTDNPQSKKQDKPLTSPKHSPRDTSAGSSKPNTSESATKPKAKKTPNDFIFGKVIGEGSYSTVYLAKEVSTQREFAIKVCDKKHLIRERKTHFVMREKEVLMKLNHPFFIKLAYTFQDSDRLYYVLTYASNGELLGYLNKLSVFDVPCTRFYTAEIVQALEYLRSLNIVHRDLKPENILLSQDFHIKITDFGTSKILSGDGKAEVKRKNSFVGTAEYVSPEVLNNIPASFGSDLWALGCIIYQCLSGSLPFRSGNEYQTFQKIVKAEYEFPEGFNPEAKDLVQKLLIVEPSERIGMSSMEDIKTHPFYAGVDWNNLATSVPPKLMPYLPATGNNPEFWGQDHRLNESSSDSTEYINTGW